MKKTLCILGALSIVLTLLWLPNIYQPILADPAEYALLGMRIWHEHAYFLYPEAYQVNYPPFYPLLAYGPSLFFGYALGMKVAGLLSGMFLLSATYVLSKRLFGFRTAVGATLLLLFHHNFILITSFGPSDLLFGALFLFSLYFYARAEEDQRWYVACGVFLGLSCLTRYNGVPGFLFFSFYTLLFRRKHLLRPWFWSGMILGSCLFLIWPIRNLLTLGTPMPGGYMEQMDSVGVTPLQMLQSNILYYGNPLRNILPIQLLLALWGMSLRTRWRWFLLGALITMLLLTSIWWSQSIRQALPAYPLLLMFSVLGFLDLYRRIRYKKAFVTIIVALIVVSNLSMLCMYTYGRCNALLDTYDVLPTKDMRLSQEGMYSWHLARQYINQSAETGAAVTVYGIWEEVEIQKHDTFRGDLIVEWSGQQSTACPRYDIAQRRAFTGTVVFATENEPITSVIRTDCPQ